MVVVDASALAAVLFSEPEGREVLDVLGCEELRAPAILPFELTNIARTKIRRRPPDALLIQEHLQAGLAQPIRLEPVDFAGVLAVALETGLTASDASYLWLARRLDAPLITLDRELASHVRWDERG